MSSYNRFVKKVDDSRVEASETVDGVKVAAKLDAPRKLKASGGFGAVKVKKSTQEMTEIDVGARVEAESDALGQLKDAKTVKEEQKKLKKKLKKKLWRERKRNERIAEKEGQTENLMPEEQNSAQKEGTLVLENRIGEKESQEGVEDEEKMEIIWVEKRGVGKEKRNVSKNGGSVEKKMGRSPYGVKGRAGVIRAKMKDEESNLVPGTSIPVAEKHFVMENGECGGSKEEKSGEVVSDRTADIEPKMKDVLVEETVGYNQECLNDLTVEIERKLKEILLLEEQIPATEVQNEPVNEEFRGKMERGNVKENGEMHWRERRARPERKFEGSLRGRWSRGEGGRRVYSWPKPRVYRGKERRDTGLMWVKKSEVSG